MLGGSWLLIAISLFIASLVLHQVTLLLVSLLFFFAGGAARLWQRYCLSRVEYGRRLSANRIFFGESVELEVEISNRKPMPLPWIEINDEIPEEVTLLKGTITASHKASRALLTNLLSLGWYHKVKRRFSIQCRQRGHFAFGPVQIRSGDPFGFFNRQMEINSVDYLTVYPKIVPLEKLGIPSKQLFGDLRVRSHLFPDPVLIAGVRDYSYGDSLKRIHWKTTARLGRLQTKVFEQTTTIDMGVFFDVRTVKPPLWGHVSQLLELGIITAASLCNDALEERFRVGLYVNQTRWFSHELIRILPSQHPDQLRHILEALAPIHPYDTMPIARLIQMEGKNLPWGSTMVVVTAVPTEELVSSLLELKRAGRQVALVIVGDGELTIHGDGLNTYRVHDDVTWRDIEKIRVETG